MTSEATDSLLNNLDKEINTTINIPASIQATLNRNLEENNTKETRPNKVRCDTDLELKTNPYNDLDITLDRGKTDPDRGLRRRRNRGSRDDECQCNNFSEVFDTSDHEEEPHKTVSSRFHVLDPGFSSEVKCRALVKLRI